MFDLHQNPRQMPMRQKGRTMSLRREHQRIQDDFMQAAGLLRHDLVWDSDFEAIRSDLADYLENRSHAGIANPESLVKVVQKLLASENDMSI